MVAIAAAVVVAFIGLYFITHHKKKSLRRFRPVKLPEMASRQEERWRYIKELESRQPGACADRTSAGGEVQNANQLTDEQRQLLAQMQADMRQQPTQLNEVPWNEQTPAQRQQTLQRVRRSSRISSNSSGRKLSRCSSRTQPRVTEQPYQQPRTVQSQPVQQQPKRSRRNRRLSRIRICCRRQRIPPRSSRKRSRPPVTKETEAPKQTAEKKTNAAGWFSAVRLKVQSRPETVRAQLAFEGFDSRITTNNGWNRVVIGPVKGKENADGTISRLKMAGHTNCIRLASGG
jgi:cell division protein FtsN